MKESYDDLLDKARKAKEVFRASAGEFIPKMLEALRKEGVDEKDAWDRIEKDLVEIWELDTIRRYKPQVIKDRKKQAAAAKSHAVRNPAQIIQNTDGSQEIRESPLVSSPSDPYSKGANEDREATRHEKQGFKLQELSQLCLQKDKTIEQLQEKLKAATSNDGLDEEYVHQLKQKIKALEEGYQVEADVELGDKWLPVTVFVRPSNKSAKVVVNEVKLRRIEA